MECIPKSMGLSVQLTASKVTHIVGFAKRMLADGHCVVIGLQSTGGRLPQSLHLFKLQAVPASVCFSTQLPLDRRKHCLCWIKPALCTADAFPTLQVQSHVAACRNEIMQAACVLFRA